MGNDTTEWRDVPGFEGYYQVSNTGLVRRIGKRILALKNNNGYREVRLHRPGAMRQYKVHRLVMLAFVGYRPGTIDVNHKNGVKHDNRLENLEYCTRKENVRHAVDVLGDLNRVMGEHHHSAKFTEDVVIEIRRLYADGSYNQKELAVIYNVSAVAIRKIVRRMSWKHLPN